MIKIARWIAIGALFLVPFLPLYVPNDLFFPFITGKGFAFRILMELAAGAWLALALMDRRYRPKWSWALLIYGAFVLWMFVADLLAVNPHKAFWSNYERMDGWVTMVHAFLFFVVAGSVLTVDKLWKRWWLAVLAGSVIVSLHGILQILGMAQIHQGGVRLDANFGNAAYLAAYLLFTVAVAVWLAVEQKGWKRYGLFALAAVETVVLYHTATRGALLGLVGASALAALLWTATGGRTGRRVGALALAGIALVVGAFFIAKDTSFVKADPTLSRIASISSAEGSTRFTLWHMAWEGALERPLTGWGQEGYNHIFNKFYEPSLYGQEAWFDRAHNVYIDWLVAGGFPALVLFLALLGAAVFSLSRANLGRAERALLIAALAAYAFQALFVFDNLLTYVLLAAVLATAHASSARPITRLEGIRELPPASRPVAVGVLLVLSLAAAWFVNAPSIQGARELIKALSGSSRDAETSLSHLRNALDSGTFGLQEVREQLVGFAAEVVRAQALPADFKSSTLALAISEMQKEVGVTPQDSRLHLMVAQGYEAGGDLSSALAELNLALAASPKKQLIIVQQGIDRWKSGDLAGAKASFDAAYALDPSFPELASYVAAGDIITGDVTAGKALLVSAFGTTTVDRDILRFAYYEAKRFSDLVALAQAKALADGGEPASRFALAQAYVLAGRVADARAEIQDTIAKHPEAGAAGAALLSSLAGK